VIPAGAKIKSAYLSTYILSVNGSMAGNKIYFCDAASPSPPTTAATANAKTKTSAYVAFNPTGTGWQETDDISTILQELVNTYGELTSLMLLLIGGPSGGYVVLGSQERTGNVYGIKIGIKYN